MNDGPIHFISIFYL